jgi:hypothetical protein
LQKSQYRAGITVSNAVYVRYAVDIGGRVKVTVLVLVVMLSGGTTSLAVDMIDWVDIVVNVDPRWSVTVAVVTVAAGGDTSTVSVKESATRNVTAVSLLDSTTVSEKSTNPPFRINETPSCNITKSDGSSPEGMAVETVVTKRVEIDRVGTNTVEIDRLGTVSTILSLVSVRGKSNFS